MARSPDQGPPKAGAWVARPNPPNTEFRRFYERSDLPLVLSHSSRKSALSWKVSAHAVEASSAACAVDCQCFASLG